MNLNKRFLNKIEVNTNYKNFLENNKVSKIHNFKKNINKIQKKKLWYKKKKIKLPYITMLQRRLFRKKILKPTNKIIANKITAFKLKKKYLKRRNRRFFKNKISFKKINLKISFKKIKKYSNKSKKILPS